jgi:hypothetical protein
LYVITGSEKQPLPDQQDLRKRTLAKQYALEQTGGKPQAIGAASMLESPEMWAGWHHLGARAEAAGDHWPPTQAFFLHPQTFNFWLHLGESEPGSEVVQAGIMTLQDMLHPIFSHPDKEAFIVFPLHIAAGIHWTSLTLYRQANSQVFDVQYRDSLPDQMELGRKIAQSALQVAERLLGTSSLSHVKVPARTPSQHQNNMIDCGFFVLMWAEEAYRQFRGEGARTLKMQAASVKSEYNKWLQHLAKTQVTLCQNPFFPPSPSAISLHQVCITHWQ